MGIKDKNLKNEISTRTILFVIIGVFFFLWLSQCSSKRKIKKAIETNMILQTNQIDSVINLRTIQLYEELKLESEIQGYKLAKRILYDQNAIVRTTIRPDDRMNEYDIKIGELEKEQKKKYEKNSRMGKK